MIADALLRRQSDSSPVKVAVVGAGRFGTSVIAQISQMAGIEVAAIADISAPNLEEAWKAYGASPESIVWAESSGAAADAVIAGKPAAGRRCLARSRASHRRGRRGDRHPRDFRARLPRRPFAWDPRR